MEKYEQYFIRLNQYKSAIANMYLTFDANDIVEFMETYTDMRSGMDHTMTTVMVF